MRRRSRGSPSPACPVDNFDQGHVTGNALMQAAGGARQATGGRRLVTTHSAGACGPLTATAVGAAKLCAGMGLTRNADLRAAADAVLARLVGDDSGEARLREDQWRAIEALVAEKRRALVVQRTGWGKSAVYFVATSLLRAQGSGPTVIVSPLLALMRNQVEAAARAGIRARTINSSNIEEWDTIQDEIGAGTVDVLLVSPERLNN